MPGAIFRTYLVLMAIISMNQPSGKHRLSPEDNKETALRMKEREVTLQQHQLHWEQEIAELEARQKSLARPLWELQRKIPWHICTLYCLLFCAVFIIWKQRRNEARGKHREEDTEVEFLGQVCTRVAFPARAPCAAQGHLHRHGQSWRMASNMV